MESDQQRNGNPVAFDADALFGGRKHTLAVRETCGGSPGTKIVMIEGADGQLEELAFERPGASSLFLRSDGSVRELSPNAELEVWRQRKPGRDTTATPPPAGQFETE
jgi:hypothetical protein